MRPGRRPDSIVIQVGYPGRFTVLADRRRMVGAFVLVVALLAPVLALSPAQAGAASQTSAGVPAADSPMALQEPRVGEHIVRPTQADLGDDDHHHGWDWGGGWWIIMPVMMLAFWGGLIAAVVWGIRSVTGRDRHVQPLDVARGRLARGEISKDEFDRIREDLE